MEESKEHGPQEPQSIEEAVRALIEGNEEAAIAYLRKNPDDTGEFCLQVRDSYSETDTSTPPLKLAGLIKKLL